MRNPGGTNQCVKMYTCEKGFPKKDDRSYMGTNGAENETLHDNKICDDKGTNCTINYIPEENCQSCYGGYHLNEKNKCVLNSE